MMISRKCCAGCRSRCGTGGRIDLRFNSSGVGVAVTPHTKHGVSRARNHPDEGKSVITGKSMPEVGADRRDDQKSRAVEDDPLARVPAADLVPPLSPHQED